DLLASQLDSRRGGILHDVMGPLGAGYRNDIGVFREKPGERDLSTGCGALRGKGGETLHEAQIVPQGLSLETGIRAAEIARPESLPVLHGPGQEGAPERAVGDKGHAQV